jgi:hypothetical protein
MKSKKNNAITLIEIMLVMGLVALLASVMQWGVQSLLKEEAFVQESRKIKEAIGFAEEVMMDTKSDLTLTLIHEEGKVRLVLSSSKLLPEKMLLQKEVCKEIDKVFFNSKQVHELILHFEGHLGRTSEGLLVLENNKGKQQSIFLHGFPGSMHHHREAS